MDIFSKRIIKLFILIVTFFLSPLIYGQAIDFIVLNTSADWENVIKSAEKEGKKVFLDIYAKWCGPCKMMDANVYTDSSVSDYFNKNFINTKIDGESEFGRTLARHYKLTAYPTMYFINSKKEIIFTIVGYRDPAALTDLGRLVVNRGQRYAALNDRYETGQMTSDEEKEYLDLLLGFNQQERFRKIVAGKLNNLTEEEILNPVNKDLIMKGGGDFDSNTVMVVIKNAEYFKTLWGAQELYRYFSDVFNASMQKLIMEKDEVKMKKITDVFIPVYLADSPEKIPAAKLTTQKIYYSQVKNWEKYIRSVEDFYTDLGNPVRKFFYNEVYYIVENQIYNDQMLTKALEWLDREIALQPDFESFFLGTIVNTYRKDFAEANNWMAKAEPLAVTDEDKNSIKELKIYIEKLKSGTTLNR